MTKISAAVDGSKHENGGSYVHNTEKSEHTPGTSPDVGDSEHERPMSPPEPGNLKRRGIEDELQVFGGA